MNLSDLRKQGDVWYNTCGAAEKQRASESIKFSYDSHTLLDYDQYLSLQALACFDKESTEQFNTIRKDVNAGRTDAANFDGRLGLMMKESQMERHGDDYVELNRLEISRVLHAYVQRNRTPGYVQGMNYIVSFLLIFMNEEKAFWTLCTLIEDIRPPDFYSKSKAAALKGFQAEVAALVELVKLQNPRHYVALGGRESINLMVQLFASKCSIPVFVKQMPLEALILVWDDLLTASCNHRTSAASLSTYNDASFALGSGDVFSATAPYDLVILRVCLALINLNSDKFDKKSIQGQGMNDDSTAYGSLSHTSISNIDMCSTPAEGGTDGLQATSVSFSSPSQTVLSPVPQYRGQKLSEIDFQDIKKLEPIEVYHSLLALTNNIDPLDLRIEMQTRARSQITQTMLTGIRQRHALRMSREWVLSHDRHLQLATHLHFNKLEVKEFARIFRFTYSAAWSYPEFKRKEEEEKARRSKILSTLDESLADLDAESREGSKKSKKSRKKLSLRERFRRTFSRDKRHSSDQARNEQVDDMLSNQDEKQSNIEYSSPECEDLQLLLPSVGETYKPEFAQKVLLHIDQFDAGDAYFMNRSQFVYFVDSVQHYLLPDRYWYDADRMFDVFDSNQVGHIDLCACLDFLNILLGPKLIHLQQRLTLLFLERDIYHCGLLRTVQLQQLRTSLSTALERTSSSSNDSSSPLSSSPPLSGSSSVKANGNEHQIRTFGERLNQAYQYIYHKVIGTALASSKASVSNPRDFARSRTMLSTHPAPSAFPSQFRIVSPSSTAGRFQRSQSFSDTGSPVGTYSVHQRASNTPPPPDCFSSFSALLQAYIQYTNGGSSPSSPSTRSPSCSSSSSTSTNSFSSFFGPTSAAVFSASAANFGIGDLIESMMIANEVQKEGKEAKTKGHKTERSQNMSRSDVDSDFRMSSLQFSGVCNDLISYSELCSSLKSCHVDIQSLFGQGLLKLNQPEQKRLLSRFTGNNETKTADELEKPTDENTTSNVSTRESEKDQTDGSDSNAAVPGSNTVSSSQSSRKFGTNSGSKASMLSPSSRMQLDKEGRKASTFAIELCLIASAVQEEWTVAEEKHHVHESDSDNLSQMYSTNKSYKDGRGDIVPDSCGFTADKLDCDTTTADYSGKDDERSYLNEDISDNGYPVTGLTGPDIAQDLARLHSHAPLTPSSGLSLSNSSTKSSLQESDTQQENYDNHHQNPNNCDVDRNTNGPQDDDSIDDAEKKEEKCSLQ